MKSTTASIDIRNFKTQSGVVCSHIPLSYELFGKPLGTAPLVLVNHAMTGNSRVCGEDGWWNPIIGQDKRIDTSKYTILAFNVPGNGYDGFLLKNYQDFVLRDIARLFVIGLDRLDIHQIHAIIGGSIGGNLSWELSVLLPDAIKTIVPVASDWKASDWIMANAKVQDCILEHSSEPLKDARMHAMNFYRTPQSYKIKFERTLNKVLNIPNVESWLLHHGKKLEGRFTLESYKLMNHLLKTMDITRGRGTFQEVIKQIKADIVMVSIDSDMLFVPQEIEETFGALQQSGKKAQHSQIHSIHGHDAFLIEFQQLDRILTPIF